VRILIIHNRYQLAGGEDSVVLAEQSLLASHGQQVELLSVDNDAIQGTFAKLTAALSSAYSFSSRGVVAEKIRSFRPDIVHLHNWFPVLSPSILYACSNAGVPVVHTLHNYRLLCPNALLFRNNGVCESCLGRSFAWPGVRHRCYRGSMAGTAIVATITWAHRTAGTFDDHVARYIALTEFARAKFIEGGIDPEKVVIKPNFVTPDPGPGSGTGDYVLFVGRLSEEKGIDTLLRTWQTARPAIKLRIIGKGPLEQQVREAAASNHMIDYLGPKSPDEVYAAMGDAKALIFSSVWYETFGLTIVEAMMKGTPIIASRIGSPGELVEDRRTGLHFEAGNAESLAAAVRWMLDHPVEWQTMRRNARAEFEAKYSADQNYTTLIKIYADAIASRELTAKS
jgi:glycosyltransferase involved in cell wall biosynthesis